MEKIALFLVTFCFVLTGFSSSPVDNRITIKPESQSAFRAGTFEYVFQLHDSVGNKMLAEQDLAESHTKKLHFITYDPSLNEFRHAHPVFDGNFWKVELNLPVNGRYFVWNQGTLLDGTEFSSLTHAAVIDGLPENPILPLTDVRKASDGQTDFELAKTKIRAGKMVMLNFKVTRSDGSTPIMEPYLGALAHVIATPAQGTELIHVHPMQGSLPNTGMIHATFPKEGAYKLWVQFIEHAELKTIPLSVIVLK